MENVKLVIYGLIVGHWLMGIRRRLMSTMVAGRYAVVAESVVMPNIRLVIGYCDTIQKANEVYDTIQDETDFFTAAIYDRADPENARFLKGEYEPFTKWEELPPDDRNDLRIARQLCDG